jgi:hypothetical protein
VVKLGAQTKVFQITALAGSTNGFSNGAVWAPNGKKLEVEFRLERTLQLRDKNLSDSQGVKNYLPVTQAKKS